MLIQFWMTLHNDFKVLCGVFYIVPILSILNQLLINCWHKKLDSNHTLIRIRKKEFLHRIHLPLLHLLTKENPKGGLVLVLMNVFF